jgi:hypothetical protein
VIKNAGNPTVPQNVNVRKSPVQETKLFLVQDQVTDPDQETMSVVNQVVNQLEPRSQSRHQSLLPNWKNLNAIQIAIGLNGVAGLIALAAMLPNVFQFVFANVNAQIHVKEMTWK